jgi:nucleotide-binding universal stress UspA family protein
MQLRKILCAVDFSAGSDEALKVAARIATEHASDLVITHTWYVPPMVYAGELAYPSELVRGLTEDAEHGLAKAVEQARGLGATKVSSLALSGPPWETIVEAAEAATDVDLIVLGTRQRSGLSRVFLGSVAEMVVRHAPCSVLVVPSGGSKEFQQTLVPIDFSPSSQLALELAADLGRGALTLVHVIEPARLTSKGAALDLGVGLTTRSRELLDQWLAKVTPPHLGTTASIRVGNPTEELRGLLLEAPRFDLVALGSHGRTGIRRLLLGSIAETVVRHAQCAVLVARQRA